MKSVYSILVLLFCFSVQAHQNTVSFLFLESVPNGIHGRYDIALKHLEFVIGLDENNDAKITWGEVRTKIPEIQKYVFDRLNFSTASGPVTLKPGEVLVEDRMLGKYLVLQFDLPQASRLSVHYDLLFELDPNHTCFLEAAGRSPLMLTSDHRSESLSFTDVPVKSALPAFIREGVTHIFGGIDHICFLVALLLPSVWKRTADGWRPAGELRSVLAAVLKVVTAFTVAHSITLSLAALHIVRLPSALVESVIALSVLLAAVNNIVPIWNDRSWPVAFAFGLMHGFGFASVLNELASNTRSLATALFGFNLGVELGQLCIVAVFVPIAFALRETRFYRFGAVRLGSGAIAAVAAVWLVERVFSVTIF